MKLVHFLWMQYLDLKSIDFERLKTMLEMSKYTYDVSPFDGKLYIDLAWYMAQKDLVNTRHSPFIKVSECIVTFELRNYYQSTLVTAQESSLKLYVDQKTQLELYYSRYKVNWWYIR